VVERIERHLPEGTMPKRAAAEAPAKGDAKKAKKAATPKRSAGTPGKGGSGGKRDVRGDDIIKLSDSDGADSDADVDARAIPVDVARKAAKKMKSKMKTNVHGAFGREKDDRPRVLYIGHVPHGFYEDQMRAYFGQFGEVTRLRLSRNKKTGKSKHYAYCEFKHPEVAAIVAESMDNYLLFESVLKVRLMTAEECHPELWKGANRKFKAVPWRRKAAEAHDKPRSAAELAKRDAALLAGERARRRKIEKAGIEYDFPGYAAAAKGGDAKSAKKTAKRAATKKEKTEEKEAPAKATKAAKAPAKETKAPAKTPAKRKAPAAEAPAKKAKTPAKEKTPAKRATRSTRASAR
jgi:nucleolar protein 15